MKIEDLAKIIHEDLGEPVTPSLTSISIWLQHAAVTQLNVLINTCFQIDGDDVTPELCDSQAAILEKMYYISYYSKEIKNNLGANAYWTEVKEGDSFIRKTSKNEIAKTYLAQKRDTQVELNDLVFYYKQNMSPPVSWNKCSCSTESGDEKKCGCS